jgi:pimeloyl-[acyl-carrier protein] methyl ester esterase
MAALPKDVLFLPGWSMPACGRAAASYVRYPSCRAWRLAQSRRFPGGIRVGTAVGWSLGGQALLRALADGTVKARHAVFVAAPVRFVDPSFPNATPERCAAFVESYRRDPEKTLRAFLRLVASGDARQREIAKALSSAEPDAYGARRLRELYAFDARRCRIPKAGTPKKVTVVHGTEDAVVSCRQAAEWRRVFPHADVQLWEGCGHAPHLSRPDDFADLL